MNRFTVQVLKKSVGFTDTLHSYWTTGLQWWKTNAGWEVVNGVLPPALTYPML